MGDGMAVVVFVNTKLMIFWFQKQKAKRPKQKAKNALRFMPSAFRTIPHGCTL